MMEENKNEIAGSIYSEAEAEFLAENFIGRLATASASGQPHVVPVAYRFDGTTITFGGWRLESSLKFKNMEANPRVAFVVDEIVSTRPWTVRGVEVRGEAEVYQTDSPGFAVKINPKRVTSWGLKKSK